MASVAPARHLLRAKDLADARYFEGLTVNDLARAAGLSRAHFSEQFRRAFGVSPHAYLLIRRLERAAALLRGTDRTVAEICMAVGLSSVGSFTSRFTRTYGKSPTAYRASFPPASTWAMIPSCVLRFYGRPPHRAAGHRPAARHRPAGEPSGQQDRTFEEDAATGADLASSTAQFVEEEK